MSPRRIEASDHYEARKRKPNPNRAIRVLEADLGELLEGHLRLLGMRYYHTRDSRRSVAGFPDYVICAGAWQLHVELKATGGRLTVAQAEWLVALAGPYRASILVVGPGGVADLVAFAVRARRAGHGDTAAAMAGAVSVLPRDGGGLVSYELGASAVLADRGAGRDRATKRAP